jgi:predicted nucleotidyltransferase
MLGSNTPTSRDMADADLSFDAIPPERARAIRDRLAAVERSHDVRVLLAVKSGSRAWGFPSPDSDYDVRFIDVHRPEWYVSVRPGRDVIEEPIDDLVDLNGWDLQKALGLMLKSNAVLVEWLTSPVRYAEASAFRDAFLDLATRSVRRLPFVHHYLKLGENMRDNRAFRRERWPIKKYFYVLRPAAALRWLRLHDAERLPPMHFPTLVAAGSLPERTRAIVSDLIARKAVTRELGDTEPVAELETFIDEEFALARARLGEGSEAAEAGPVLPEADRFLRAWVFERARR